MRTSLLGRVALALLAVVVAGLAFVFQWRARSGLETASRELIDLHDVQTLRDQFNRDAGFPRLLLIVSPT